MRQAGDGGRVDDIKCQDADVCVAGGDKPEFDDWEWVSYWYPVGQVVDFKREVYRKAMKELVVPLGQHIRRSKGERQ